MLIFDRSFVRPNTQRALRVLIEQSDCIIPSEPKILRLVFEGNVVLDIEPTSLRLDPWYIYYYVHWTRLVITGLVPMTFLATVNILIFVLIRRQNIERSRKMSVNSHGSRAEARYFYNRKFLLNCINFQLLTFN